MNGQTDERVKDQNEEMNEQQKQALDRAASQLPQLGPDLVRSSPTQIRS